MFLPPTPSLSLLAILSVVFNFLNRMKKFKKIFIAFILFLSFVFIKQPVVFAYNFATESGLDKTATEAGYEIDSEQTPENFIGQIIQVVLSLIGVLFLILTIYAGALWITAQGNEQKAEKAKDIIIGSVIGLVIVIAAYAITIFAYNYFGTIE